MNQNNYSTNLLLILAGVNITIQIISVFLSGEYSFILLFISAAMSVFIWVVLNSKHNQQSIENEVINRATSLVEALKQATTQKNLEEPLLASKNTDPLLLNTRLYITSLYLLLCIVGIRQSKGKVSYIKSQQFNTLLSQTKPTIEKAYTERSTKKERISILIQNNYQQIKQLITSYCNYTKKHNSDPTLPLQAWFEQKSHIDLSVQPYIAKNLSESAVSEAEITFIYDLCRPKKYTKLLHKIRETTETFMGLLNKTNRFQLSDDNEILDYHYIEKYLSAFLLIYGLVVIKESKGNITYIESEEYKALHNKTSNMIKAMILNSRQLGVESLTQPQIEHLIEFVEKQLPSVEMACLDYFKAQENKVQTPEIYLFEWFNTTTNHQTNFPFQLNQYIQQLLASDTTDDS